MGEWKVSLWLLNRPQEELIAFCKNIASFKRPRHVLFMQDDPMTASGKGQKFNLRKLTMRALNMLDDDDDG